MTIEHAAPTRVGYPELCSRCDRTTAMALTRSGKSIKMNFQPSAEGNFHIVGTRDGKSIVARISKSALPNPDELRFSCHWDRGQCRSSGMRRSNRYGQSFSVNPFG